MVTKSATTKTTTTTTTKKVATKAASVAAPEPVATKTTKKTTTTTTTPAAVTKKPVATTTKKVVEEEILDGPKAMAPITPPYSLRINRYKQTVVAKITLHKIPDKFINLHPTSTNFHMDTLKYTKKFVLDLPYPEGVEVDDNKAEVTFEHDILTVYLPITKGFNEPQNNKNKKNQQNKKRKVSQVTKQEKTQQQEEEQTTTTTTTEESQEEQQQEEQEQQQQVPKKKKKFADTESSISLINDLSEQQDKKNTLKIENEKKKSKAMESKADEKQQKKQNKVTRKENVIKKLSGQPVVEEPIVEEPVVEEPVVQEKPKSVKKVKKSAAPAPVAADPSPKKVSFGKANVKIIPARANKK